MKTRDWKDIAEIAGIAAIVASLVFVGLQMRQSHEIALVTLYQMRADAGREVLLASLENESLLNAIEKEQTGQGDSTFAEDYLLTLDMNIIVNHFENSHFLYQRGFLPEEHWQSDVLTLTSILEDRWAMERWQEMKFRFRQSYVEAIDDALRQKGTLAGSTSSNQANDEVVVDQ